MQEQETAEVGWESLVGRLSLLYLYHGLLLHMPISYTPQCSKPTDLLAAAAADAVAAQQ